MDKVLVTRAECRQLGLDVSNTTFLRWEDAKLLTPLKAGDFRSSVVRYRVEEVNQLLTARPPKQTL